MWVDIIGLFGAILLVGSCLRIATLNTNGSKPSDHDHL